MTDTRIVNTQYRYKPPPRKRKTTPLAGPAVVAALPTAQDVEFSLAAWGWTWSYRLGNRTVWGPATKTRVAVLCSLDAHLAARGLALPEEPSR